MREMNYAVLRTHSYRRLIMRTWAYHLVLAILFSLVSGLNLSGEQGVGEGAAGDARKLNHWSYQRPVRPPVPVAHASPWGRDPIDAFLAAEHKRDQLVPAEPAQKTVLLRRVFLDLIGLSPSPAEIDEYLADSSPDAYERVIDRVLASPRYGERWGRHWMDVWRYSDWKGNGITVRHSRPHMWRWRDWIVESLNGDKGYDRMVIEMLAADELAPLDHDMLRATGFLARHWFRYNRDTWLFDTVEHTSKAFLGTTFNCARCHDHKFDPIKMKDYYRLRAVFEPYEVRDDRVPGEPSGPSKLAPRRRGGPPFLNSGVARVYDADPDRPTYLYLLGNARQAVKEDSLKPAVPSFLGSRLEVQQVQLPREAYYPGLQRFVQEENLAMAASDIEVARQALDAAKLEENKDQRELELAKKSLAAAESYQVALAGRIAAERAKYGLDEDANHGQLASAASKAERIANVDKFEAQLAEAEGELADAREALKPDDPATQRAVTIAEGTVSKTRKELDKAQEALEKESSEYSTLGGVFGRTSSGRRLALARWIVARENPLAARVAVNHIWMRHFNAPLVPSVFDFGIRAPKPRLVSVLDYLAVELVESGWSMKNLHRTLVASEAYRMSSSTNYGDAQANLATDSDNLLLWRMNSRRLEAEGVRDNVLHVGGSLDLRMGGPEINYTSGQTTWRRSLYFRQCQGRQMKFLSIFDGPTAIECYRRKESVLPQQALALYNSPLSWNQARLLAKNLSEDTAASEKPADAFVDAAFRTVLCRPAKPQEIEECLNYLKDYERLPVTKSIPQRGRENLVLVLLNHNDFVTVR